MSDIKDIMGVARPVAALPFESEAPAKPKAPKMKRPEHMSREAFALHDGSHPIAPTHLPEGLKKPSDLQGLKQKRLQTSKGKARPHACGGGAAIQLLWLFQHCTLAPEAAGVNCTA